MGALDSLIVGSWCWFTGIVLAQRDPIITHEVVWFPNVVPDVDNTVQDCAMESAWVCDVWLWCFKFPLKYLALDGC